MTSPKRAIAFFKSSIIIKHSFIFFLGLIIILSSSFGMVYLRVSKMMSDAVWREAEQICKSAVNEFDQQFYKIESIAKTTARHLEKCNPSEWNSILLSTLDVAVRQCPEVRGLCLGLNPSSSFAKNKKISYVCEYDCDKAVFTSPEDYVERNWYQNSEKYLKGMWCEPFVGLWFTEYLAPYEEPLFEISPEGEKQFLGSLAMAFSLAKINKSIQNMKMDKTDYAFLISSEDKILASPFPESVGHSVEEIPKIINFPFNIEKYDEAASHEYGKFVMKGKSYKDDICICFHKMKTTGYILGLAFHQNLLFAALSSFNFTIIITILEVLILLSLVLLIFSMSIYKPMKKLTYFAEVIGKGNFSEPAPAVRGNNEISVLAKTIDNMRHSIVEYVENIKAITVAQEKFQSELKIAREIQNGILPQMKPPFPVTQYFHLAAKLIPAKEVGGDLYDFALIQPDKLCFVIGDVAGKGIPASLFMSITQTLHRSFLHESEFTPAELVSKVNKALCHTNGAKLFVTYLFGIIDGKTGIMTYCNAGHDPFYILKNNGTLEESCCRTGIPLGVVENFEYKQSEIKLDKGDSVILYTDGIPEAENPSGEFFGMENFKKLLKKCAVRKLDPEDTSSFILNSVKEFSGTGEWSDDIAYLCIKIR